jgi:hypothetical protein
MRFLRSRLVRLAFVTLVVALYPLEAAQAYSYSLWASAGVGSGYGQVEGTLSFNSKVKFTWDASVIDLCPSDQVGVSYKFSVTTVGGSVTNTGYKGWDTNGCNPENWIGSGGDVNWPNNIKSVAAIMCFTDNGNMCAWVAQVSGEKDNPHT